jgi:hypothetical protein
LNQIVEGGVEMVVLSLAIEVMSENWKSVGAYDSYFGSYWRKYVRLRRLKGNTK